MTPPHLIVMIDLRYVHSGHCHCTIGPGAVFHPTPGLQYKWADNSDIDVIVDNTKQLEIELVLEKVTSHGRD